MKSRIPIQLSIFVAIAATLGACGGSDPPATANLIFFAADRTSLNAGECTLLHWEVTSGFGVTVDSQPVDKVGQMEVCPTANRAYILAVDVGSGVERRDVLIQVQHGSVMSPEVSVTAASASPWTLDPMTLQPFTSGEPYQGFETGLYPGGSNTIPEPHLQAGEQIAATIQPLNSDGQVDETNGRILALAMGHSNCFAYFTAIQSAFADQAAGIDPHVQLLNAAVGGNQLPQIATLEGGVWTQAAEVIGQAGYSALQVQVLFLHTTYHGCCNDEGTPPEEFPSYMQAMQSDLLKVLNHALQVYPNLQIAYLTADGFRYYRNFEPHVWREAFAFKWLIETQIDGAPETAFSGPDRQVPWLQWGPYIWDSTWDESYFSDGVHPSETALDIVVGEYWEFLQADPIARIWLFK